VYIYGENSITLLGTDSKTASDTYLIQLNLQPTPTSVLNDLIEVTSYAEKTQKETNLLMIKAEKLSADSTVKCIKKLKSSSFSVSSSRKVLSLLVSGKHRVKIFELEVEEEDEDMEENDAESVSEENSANQETMENHNNMSSANNSKIPASPLVNESIKANSFMKTFGKHQSASSTCSLAPSVCSSTGATIATSITLDSSANFLRSKRKKILDEDDEEEDAANESQTFNDTNSTFSNIREDQNEVKNSSEMNPSNL